MVDDTDDPAPGSQRTRPSKLKYMNVLQDVANRTKSDILIDLNDLEAVCRAWAEYKCARLSTTAVREGIRRRRQQLQAG